ncbi:hypothetical protein PPERSA_05921 [Pseudocohnilembus persalinus]|uniref:Plasma membrane fusion protein PRM1 n=1 Tax=Pseudocohnilembus persalinus TaxID=266149 RepID=A0A0V0R443_PSEPJ|nr:hypothetical protein PPERSA_05921 [Pseudocohnilembus persalinus]|eukprot:KRX09252.1 hypothetical protein PPERSA_05921 [Pseudocohnilembus persalinus]
MKNLLLLILIVIGIFSLAQANNNFTSRRQLNQDDAENLKSEVCVDVSGDENEVVDEDTLESWNSKSESLDNKFDYNLYEEIMRDGGDSGKSLMDLAMSIIVYLVFSGLSIIGFFIYLYFSYCCCARCCQPKKETQGIALKWPLIGTAVTGLAVFIVSCIGVSRAGGIQSSVDSLFCFGQIALYGANYGDDSDDSEYGGLQQLVEDIEDFKDNELANLFTEINTYFGTNDLSWMTAHKDRIDRTEGFLLQECTGASDCCDQLNTSPADTDICNSGDWGVGSITYTYSTDFSGYNSGQSSTDSVYFAGSGSTSVWDQTVNEFDSNFSDIYDSLYTAMSDMKTQGYKLSQEGVTSFSDKLDEGVQLVKDFQEDAYQYQLDLNDYHEDAKNVTSLFTTVVQIFFIIFIVFSGAAIGISILFIFKKPYKLRYLLHASWCIFMFTAVFTFILTGVSLGVGYMGQQTCTVMSNTLYDEQMQLRYVANGVLDEDIAEKIFICSRTLNTEDSKYGGDGSITKVFDGMNDTLEDINSLSDKMADFGEKAGTSSENLTELNQIITAIDEWHTLLGEIYEAQEFTANGNSIDERIDISNIKSYFDSQVNTDFSYTDTLIQQASECGGSQTSLAGNEDDTNTANSYCVSMVTGYNTGSNTRYNGGSIHTFIDSLNTHMGESSDLFEDFKQGQLTSYKSVINNFITDYVAEAGNIETFIASNQAAIDKIAGPNGIIQSVECFWIGAQLENAYKVMCAKFVYSIYNLGVILSWFSFTIFFTSFFIYFSVRRLGNNVRVKDKGVQQDPDQEYVKANQQSEIQM